jgi:hypothetical protein
MSSPPPPVIFRRKAKPATRTRQTSPPENGAADATTETAENSPSTLAIKLKNKIKKTSKTKSRLSFGGDDNDDEVRVSNSLEGLMLIFIIMVGRVGWGWGGFQSQKIEFESEDGAWDTSCVGSFLSSSILPRLIVLG